MLVGEVVPSVTVVGIVLPNGCLRTETHYQQTYPGSSKVGATHPLSVRKIWAPPLPMDLLLAIGLETIPLGATIFVSDALQQTITIGDGVTAFRSVVASLDLFGEFGCFQRLDGFRLVGVGGDIDGEAAGFSGIRATIATRFAPEEFSLDALCGRHRPGTGRGFVYEVGWKRRRGPGSELRKNLRFNSQLERSASVSDKVGDIIQRSASLTMSVRIFPPSDEKHDDFEFHLDGFMGKWSITFLSVIPIFF